MCWLVLYALFFKVCYSVTQFYKMLGEKNIYSIVKKDWEMLYTKWLFKNSQYRLSY